MRYDKHIEQMPGYQNGNSSTSVITGQSQRGNHVSESIILELSDDVVGRARQVAERIHARLETILTRWINLGMADAAARELTNEAALTGEDRTMLLEQQVEMADLVARRDELSAAEQFRLDELLRIYRQSLVRRAQSVTDWLVLGGSTGVEVNVSQLSRLDSSMLYAVGYDPKSETLEVVFNSGGIYRYSDVPSSVYDGLLASESPGRYMWTEIINLYPYERLRRDRE